MLSALRVQQRTNRTTILRLDRLWRAAQASFCLTAAFAVSGCVAFWPSESDRMQKDIYDIKTELNRTRDVVLANDKVMAASLRAIEQRLSPQATQAQAQTFAPASAAPAEARYSAPAPAAMAATTKTPMAKAPVAVAPPVLTPKPSGKTKEMASAPPLAPAPQPRAPELPKPVERPVDIGNVAPRASGATASPSASAEALTASPPVQAPAPVAAPPLAAETKADQKSKPGAATPDASAERQFDEGLQSFASDPMAAYAIFERIVRSDPGNPKAYEAQFWAAESLNKSQRYPDAIRAYETVLRNYSGSPREAESAAKIGSCYYKMKDMTRARQSLQAVVDRYPNYVRIEDVKKLLTAIPR